SSYASTEACNAASSADVNGTCSGGLTGCARWASCETGTRLWRFDERSAAVLLGLLALGGGASARLPMPPPGLVPAWTVVVRSTVTDVSPGIAAVPLLASRTAFGVQSILLCTSAPPAPTA